MALDDPDYWLEKYLSQADCGNRNRAGFLLCTQLRDNRVPKQAAKETMRRYAEEVPRCSGDPYTEREALSTLRYVYSSESREPCIPEENGDSKLQRRARARERELLDQFKEDPRSLTEMERKRLQESPVHDLPLDLYETELAKDHMTRSERSMFAYCCRTTGRDYYAKGKLDPEDLCDCGRAEYSWIEGPRTKMTVEFDEVTSESLREVADEIKRTALERRANSLNGQKRTRSRAYQRS